jgi:hypothetical protein
MKNGNQKNNLVFEQNGLKVKIAGDIIIDVGEFIDKLQARIVDIIHLQNFLDNVTIYSTLFPFSNYSLIKIVGSGTKLELTYAHAFCDNKYFTTITFGDYFEFYLSSNTVNKHTIPNKRWCAASKLCDANINNKYEMDSDVYYGFSSIKIIKNSTFDTEPIYIYLYPSSLSIATADNVGGDEKNMGKDN